ncbi:FAD-dependent oxidoreductase, partial [Enterococcus faecalis]|uniref:FAD-dependent oxidoreductase n=1 Tax=Enterococcus faecalis TaxID=1351 RepID=UPI0021E05AFA
FGTGRQPKTKKLSIENTKVALDERGYVNVDNFHNHTQKSIYAVGDVMGKIELTTVEIATERRMSERLINGKTDLYLD